MALKRSDEHRFTYRLYDSDDRDRRIVQMQNELLEQGFYRNQNALIREGIRLAYHKAKGYSSMEKELVDIHTIAEGISDFYLKKMQEMMVAHDMKMLVAVSQGSLAGMLQMGQPLQLTNMGVGVQEAIQSGAQVCAPDANGMEVSSTESLSKNLEGELPDQTSELSDASRDFLMSLNGV